MKRRLLDWLRGPSCDRCGTRDANGFVHGHSLASGRGHLCMDCCEAAYEPTPVDRSAS